MGYPPSKNFFIYIVLAALFAFLPASAAALSEILETRIAAVGDDAEEGTDGTVTLNESVIDMGIPGRRLGLRFRNVNLPKNAPITRAYIEFTAAAADAGNVTLKIEVQDSDNAPAWSAVANNISGRLVHTTKAYWNVTYDWQTTGQTHQSEELKALVQKIVNRSGWQPGNAIAFILSSDHYTGRRAKAADLNLGEAAKLHIEYAANMIDVPIQAAADDMFHDAGVSNGIVYDEHYTRIGTSAPSTEWFSGYRFTNVNIPQGAVINFATLRFVAYDDYAAQTGNAVIRGEARLNPPGFSAVDQSIDAVARRAKSATVPKTASSVTWTTFQDWSRDQSYASPDLTQIVQEIIGQAGWDTSDKSLVLLFGPNGLNPQRHVYARNHSEDKAPVLHVEWGAGGAGVPVMSPSATNIGQMVSEGSSAADKSFDMMNSGQGTLNYTLSASYLSAATGWFSITPANASGTIAAGGKQTFTIAYNPIGLAPGNHEAKLRFSAPNAANSPQDVLVSLSVIEPGIATCADAPLYTRNVSNPAVLIQMDVSGSMASPVLMFDENDTTARTPDLKNLLQPLVNQDAWTAGNAAAFFLEHVSGAGMRYFNAADNDSGAAPLLVVRYTDQGVIKTLKQRVFRFADDGINCPECGTNWNMAYVHWWSGVEIRPATPANNGVLLRFQNLSIPKGAPITQAYIHFVPMVTYSGAIRVKISAEASPNAAPFPSDQTDVLATRPRLGENVLWDIPDWTGVQQTTRADVAKSAVRELVKSPDIAWGFGTWTSGSPWDQAADGSYVLIHAGCKPNTAEHQNRLQAAIAANSGAFNATPFSRSLLGARSYFQGQKKDDDLGTAGYEDGQLYNPVDCQPKFLIEMTDGAGNVDSTVENTRDRAHALADAGVSAIGVGFGLSPDEAGQLFAMAEVANARGKASNSDYLYAMNPEDASGQVKPFMAGNQKELMDAFKSILTNIQGVSFYGSAPAATTSADLGDAVMVASFTSGSWSGELQAIKKAANGSWTTGIWKATENVPAVRSVWTVDGGYNITAYTDSTLSGDNWLCKKLGDIIHSTPVVVGPPPYYYPFDQYAAFKRDRSLVHKRDNLVYVGSNDGLLHVFNLADGKEKWAFLPRSLQARLNLAANGPTYDMCSAGYCHKYLLDGTPQVADVFAEFGGGTKKWRTLLVVGQRKGGTAYSALDVTSGQSPDPSNPDPAKFLWEFTDADLGQSWADAAIERVKDATGATGATAWGAFFGSGYHENENLQPQKEALLYGIQADTGAGLWKNGANTVNKIKIFADSGTIGYCNAQGGNFVVGETVTGRASHVSGKVAAVTGECPGTLTLSNLSGTNFQVGEFLDGDLGHAAPVTVGFSLTPASTQKNNALSSPLVVNFNPGDHIEDALYTGDLYGNMFRVDQIGKGQTPAVSRLFKFNPYPANPDANPIRARATNAYGGNADEMWVYFGTGRYETQADAGTSSQQYFFGLKDGATPRATPYTLSDLRPLDARFVSATVGGAAVKVRTVSGANPNGEPWALKLFAGQSDWGGPASATGSERIITKPLVVGGIVFFTSFIPDAITCGSSGDTWVFALDYKTGLPPANPVFDLNGDGKFTDADKVEINGNRFVPVGLYVGRGQGSHPVLFKDTLFVTTSTPVLGEANGGGGGQITGLNPLKVNIPQKKIRVESWKHN
jgi:hypothetical protein